MTPYYIMKKSMILLKVKDWVLRGKMKSTLRIPSQILVIFKEEEKERYQRIKVSKIGGVNLEKIILVNQSISNTYMPFWLLSN